MSEALLDQGGNKGELVRLRINDLFGDVEVWQRMDLAEKRHVACSKIQDTVLLTLVFYSLLLN